MLTQSHMVSIIILKNTLLKMNHSKVPHTVKHIYFHPFYTLLQNIYLMVNFGSGLYINGYFRNHIFVNKNKWMTFNIHT